MMVSLAQLWLPIVVAAVGVFVASSLVHMVFKWHNSDHRKLPNEDDVRKVLGGANAPGQYFVPHCADHSDLKKPEVLQKFVEGPVGMLTVWPSGAPTMGKQLGLWFAFNVVIAIFVAYLASRAIPAGAGAGQIARVVCTVTFLSYAGGNVTNAIWMGKPWSTAAKDVLDALIYGAVSALAFAWLWPGK